MDIKNTVYFKQVDLLLQVLPFVSSIEDFALKGGTAINLFVRDFPRLSVDIDLTYMPIEDRAISLANIDAHLREISTLCQQYIPGIQIHTKEQNGLLYGITIAQSETVVKIEPNTTIRGTVFPTTRLTLSAKAQELFGRSVEVRSLSLEDLYGGKLCAAFDRQHPRDLFDVYYLYQNDGIREKVRQAFIVYLLSHNRPISELLAPQLKENLEETYRETFDGMTFKPIELTQLIEVWHKVVAKINQDFTDDEKEFILSFKRKSPQWELFPVKGIEALPSLQWKLLNLGKMSDRKHQQAYKKLEQHLHV